MEPIQFAYWLQGFIELNSGAMPTQEQWDSIKRHHATMFTNITSVPELPADWPDEEFISPHPLFTQPAIAPTFMLQPSIMIC